MKVTLLNDHEYSQRALDIYAELENHSRGEILVTRLEPVTKELIDSMPALKIIGSSTTGLEHIDVKYAESKGVKVISLLDCRDKIGQISSTAEHTFALILAIVRNIVKAHESVVTTPQHRETLKGSELRGKTLGILGMGRVGKMVAGYAASGSHRA